MTTYLINPKGYYFSIKCPLRKALLKDCQFFDSDESMWQAVCDQQGLQYDEVAGLSIIISEYYEEFDSRGIQVEPWDGEILDERSIERYINNWEC